MLLFQENPDKIFTEILESAFKFSLDIIKEGEAYNDFRDYYGLFPQASRIFAPTKAKEVLLELIKYNKDSGLWEINVYHYCLIYDLLKNFCEAIKDRIEDSQPILTVDEFKIWELDFERMVAIYFSDTDFLIEPTAFQDMSVELKDQMGFTEDTFPVVMGMNPHPDELKIRLIERGEFKPEDPAPHNYKKGARVYPKEIEITKEEEEKYA